MDTNLIIEYADEREYVVVEHMSQHVYLSVARVYHEDANATTASQWLTLEQAKELGEALLRFSEGK